jgi:hypothetical protein
MDSRNVTIEGTWHHTQFNLTVNIILHRTERNTTFYGYIGTLYETRRCHVYWAIQKILAAGRPLRPLLNIFILTSPSRKDLPTNVFESAIWLYTAGQIAGWLYRMMGENQEQEDA